MVSSHAATEAKKALESRLTDLAAREQNLQKEFSALQTDRGGLAEAVEPAVRSKYERLFKQKGQHVVVGIQHGVCAGCHMQLSRAIVVACQSDQEIVTCINCGRILYYDPARDAPQRKPVQGESIAASIVRSRWLYAAATLATVGAGLASRAFSRHLPWWLAKNLGDALYATMVFWGFGLLAPRAATRRVALAAIAFCFAIELSQAYHAAWIDSVRATTPGRLVLGQGFHAFDLVCYVLGVALAVALEVRARRVATHRPR